MTPAAITTIMLLSATELPAPREAAPVQVAEAPPPPKAPRRSTAMFGSGIALASIGTVACMSGIGLLMADSDPWMGERPKSSSAGTWGATLAIGGPVLAAGGLIMAVYGGERERAPGAPPIGIDKQSEGKRQNAPLFGIGLAMTIAGSAALNVGGALLVTTDSDRAHRDGAALAVGGAIVTGMGLTMAIVGGRRVREESIAVAPIVDTKSAGAGAVVRF